MSFINIFSKIINGAIIFTGNTLGLSKGNNSNNAGTCDSIGAFISKDKNLQVKTYPFGTTSSFSNNSSSAQLTIPPNSKVLYSQLIWSGSYKVEGQDYSSLINNPINFYTPISKENPMKIYPSTRNLFKNGTTFFYSNSSNVTNLISQSLTGIYAAGNIVGTTSPIDNSNNCCGWTLAVIYENATLSFKNVNLFVGGEFITPTSKLTFPIDIQNLKTPENKLNVKGTLFLSALKGNADKTGDQVLFGSTENDLTVLSGPNNLSSNFFGSQINNNEGIIDDTGSFGDRNQDVKETKNIVGGRQGIDITTLDISNILKPNQNSGIIEFKTTEDTFIPTAFGLQLDIDAPIFTLTKNLNTNFVINPNTIIDYTITIENTGSRDGFNCILKNIFPSGLKFNEGSVKINSTSNSLANIEKGINLNTISPKDTITVEFSATLIRLPYDKPEYCTYPFIEYSFSQFNKVFKGTFQNSEPIKIETSAFLLPPLIPNYTQIGYKNTPLKGKVTAISSTTTIKSYSLNSTPNYGYAQINNDGSFVYTPKVNFYGIDTFSILATDNNGDSSIGFITIKIKNMYENEDPLKFHINHLIFPKGGIKPCH